VKAVVTGVAGPYQRYNSHINPPCIYMVKAFPIILKELEGVGIQPPYPVTKEDVKVSLYM